MELKVDGSKCIGCGACVASFQDNFDFDGETGLSTVISSENATEDMCSVCPVGAISLEGAAEAPVEAPVEEEEQIAA